MTHPRDMDPRDLAAAIGKLTGNDEVSQDILSGRLGAGEVMPLLAGLIEGTVVQLFVPISGARRYAGFTPSRGPLRATVELLDGSHITITLEATS